MSGHSKWSTIKHKKAAIDKKRGKLWSKLSRKITVEARMGGGSMDENPRLRLVVDKAKDANMPKDTIEKAIKKGTGELGGDSFEEVVYEGYGPGGVAILARVLTDNRHRTAGELRFLFERYGGNLGATGCVAFMFTQKGVIVIPADAVSEERIMELALEAGADDVSVSETIYEVTTDTQAFEGVKRAIGEAGIAIVSADLSMVAGTSVSLELGIARRVVKLLDALEDHDDVDAIYSNTDFSDEVVAALSKEA